MSSLTAQPHFYTIEEYLRIERDSTQKHEFRQGEIVAMAGASPEHALIAANVLREFGNALKGKPCRVYSNDLKVAAAHGSRIAYPDASIICGPSAIHPAAGAMRDVVTNPRVLIEVLSPSTEHYDRTDKFDLYREIESFEEYVLVAQGSPRVEVYRRYPDESWRFEAFIGMEASARLGSVEIAVPLREIYAGITFPTALLNEAGSAS
jgi:Uma2 family endonuclease